MGNDLVQRKERPEVNYFEAVKLLNEVKDGVNHSTESITYALFLTGDISDGMRGEDKIETFAEQRIVDGNILLS